MNLDELLDFLGFVPDVFTVQILRGNTTEPPIVLTNWQKIFDYIYEHDNYNVITCTASKPKKTASVTIQKWCDSNE